MCLNSSLTPSNLKIFTDFFCLYVLTQGSQIPSDGDDEESDNKDEVIVLSDFYLLADDDLKTYFVKIPVGCKLTVVLDSCHR